MVEAQLVAPCHQPEINLLSVRHIRPCENHSVKGEKKAYGCERSACGGGHRCTPSIRQWTKTKLTPCLRMRCEGPHTDGKMFITSSADSHCVFHITFDRSRLSAGERIVASPIAGGNDESAMSVPGTKLSFPVVRAMIAIEGKAGIRRAAPKAEIDPTKCRHGCAFSLRPASTRCRAPRPSKSVPVTPV